MTRNLRRLILGRQTTWGENLMARHRDWKDMTSEEKFEFLFEWCDGLNDSLQKARNEVQLLHGRLRKAEAQLKQWRV
jgi:hypothetical protein